MKTIAVSMDEDLLEAIDHLARQKPSASSRRATSRRTRPNRSEIVRLAVRDFVHQQQKREREERERRVLATHRKLLARQAAVLVAEQADE